MRVLLSSAFLLAASLGSNAQAALYTVNFEESSFSDRGNPISSPYLGLNWGTGSALIGTLNGSHFFTNQTGYVYGAVDGPRTAYNRNGLDTSIVSDNGTPFAYVSGTWSASFGSFDLTLQGFLQGKSQFATTQTIFERTPTVIGGPTFSGKAIDELRIPGNIDELPWALDHFQFSSPVAVPEPDAAVYLFAAGLVLLVAATRRRR